MKTDFEVSAQHYIEPSKWSAEAGKVKGNAEAARSINQYPDSLRQQFMIIKNKSRKQD